MSYDGSTLLTGVPSATLATFAQLVDSKAKAGTGRKRNGIFGEEKGGFANELEGALVAWMGTHPAPGAAVVPFQNAQPYGGGRGDREGEWVPIQTSRFGGGWLDRRTVIQFVQAAEQNGKTTATASGEAMAAWS